MEVQDRIRQLMQKRNWTEYRLAKESELSQATVSNLFRRNNSPSLSTLEAICKSFDITLSQFFADDNELIELTREQRELFDKWATLTPRQKRAILDLISSL